MTDLTNYKRMYAILCAAASKALDLLPELPVNEAGRELLKTALLEAEEIYVGDGEEAEALRE